MPVVAKVSTYTVWVTGELTRCHTPGAVTLKFEPPSWLPGPTMAGRPVSAVAPMVVPFVTDGIAVAIAVPQASPARLNWARTV